MEHDLGRDGLNISWGGDIWLNPPYGQQLPVWIDKFLDHRKGVMLVFARMGNSGVQKCLNQGATFFFIRKRVRFLDNKGIIAPHNPGADSCFIFFDPKYIQRIKDAKIEGEFSK